MTKDEMIFQQGRLSGLKEACELTGVINTGKANYEPLLTLIRELNIKLQGTTVHDCECKKKARELIVRIINGHFMKETEDGLWYFDQNELAKTISHDFNLSEGE